MPSPMVRRYLLSALLVVALVAFGYYALQPVRVACTLDSGPYGSTFTPNSAHASGDGQCGEERTRFLTWIGR
ncbi:hypothetical protein A6P39_040320 [Streptomyces sp. FXJ1.172]|uniref:hypothetical protein n=1 Tax=Streptomyces sp. FXJ1.172 TaxID=710705 RepID=UPI0007CFF25D|nr:hypothetical protein [Streptomyces sp. FXJ1.172]WEO99794.1 hypothetical protein A6P39_040320 [Streptomyces sp. FXJ1.172]